MRFLAVVLAIVCETAFAHESVLPHQHPHGVSALPDLSSLGLGALAIAAVWLIARRFGAE
jgi:hypothetical protein